MLLASPLAATCHGHGVADVETDPVLDLFVDPVMCLQVSCPAGSLLAVCSSLVFHESLAVEGSRAP